MALRDPADQALAHYNILIFQLTDSPFACRVVSALRSRQSKQPGRAGIIMVAGSQYGNCKTQLTNRRGKFLQRMGNG